MSYPGNPSLEPEVQQRAQTTFAQTLGLVTQGRDQEALTGCEFVLRLDPMFQPAKQLQQRLQSPQRPVVVDDLRPESPTPQATDTIRMSPGAPAPQAGDTMRLENVAELAPLDDAVELGSLDDLDAAPTAPAPAAPAPPATPASPVAPPAATVEATPVGETLLELTDEPSLELADEPLELADEPSLELADDAGAEDDFLALQQQSLSLDQEHDDPLSEIDGEMPDLDSLDLDDDEDLPDLDDAEPLDLDDAEPLDLGGDEPLDLGLGGDEPLALGGDEPLALGGEESIGLAPQAAPPQAVPPEAPPAPAPSEPAPAPPADADEGGQERIDQLLAEGQEVFDRGEFQGAIDVWSRIFLIDVTHGEASRCIEEARGKKAELERQAEEDFHEAVAFIEQESLDEAKEALGRVLEIDASHSLAREYLEKLEAGQVPAVKPRAAEAADSDLAAEDLLGAGTSETEASLEAAVMRDRVVVVKKTDKKLIVAGVAVALLVIGGGGWLILNKDKLFPNSQTPPQAVRRVDPIAKATKLHELGEIEAALAVLRGVPVPDPSYQAALALIDQWEAQMVEEAVDTGPPPELLARRERYLGAARQGHLARRFIRSRRYFENAAKVLALEEADQALLDDCNAQLLPLADAIQRYQERDYAQILPDLWRQLDEEPDNHDVVLLIVDSYYNLALSDLQRNDPAAAAQKLADALDADPENEELNRLHLFSESYSTRSPDLLYLIFVKYLPSR